MADFLKLLALQMDVTRAEAMYLELELECNLRGRCPFLRISTTRLGKKFAFRYPVSELLDYKKFQKQ